MKLSIIIVSWNVREDLVRCLRSIEENRPMSEFEVIVVDNASSDGTVDAVRCDFPEVTIIANKENRGYAAANKQAVEKSRGEYTLFLNPDSIMLPETLDKLIEFMDDNEDVGICGPKLLNEDGTIQATVRRFPDFRSAWYRYTIFKALCIFRRHHHRYMMYDFSYDRQMDVDQVIGAALMTRRSIIDELGGMDELFFMYYEEVDFCYRVKNAGWRIVFVPDIVITHFGGRSSEQIPIEVRAMSLTSVLGYFRKNRGAFVTGLFNVLFKPAVILRCILDIVVGLLTCGLATLLLNRKRQLKSAVKVKRTAIWLWRYSWQLLFKM